MLLDVFFTRSEMKNGISTIARVEELFSEIHKLKTCVTGKADELRQWAIVACTLAATEKIECLDHFIQLNGLSFLNRWLQEAQKGDSDAIGSVAEELINVLLSLLEKLAIGSEQSISSGLGATVEQLLFHMNITIKEKAKILNDNWHHAKGDGLSSHDSKRIENTQTDKAKASEFVQTSPSRGGSSEGSWKMVPVQNDMNSNIIRCSDSSEPHSSNNENFPLSNQKQTTSNPADANAVLDVNYSGSSIFSSTCQEKLSAIEESSDSAAAGLVSSRSCSSQFGKGKDDGLDVTVNDASDGLEVMDVDNITDDPCKNVQRENCSVSSSSSLFATNRKEAAGGDNGHKDHSEIDLMATKGLCPLNIDDSSKLLEAKADDLMKQRSKMHIEHEDIDSQEIARQIAIQVEEVGEYGETTCSSPEVHSGQIVAACTPGLEKAKQDQPVIGEIEGSKSLAVKGYYTGSVSSLKEDDSGITENISFPGEKDEPHLESSISDIAAQESVNVTDRNGCEFDLNENICSEELGYLVKPAAAVPIHVSASIPVAVSKGALLLPLNSLHVEGELGWNSAAVTSAFRPVSPRRTDVENTSSGPIQPLRFLGVDLNVTEAEDDVATGPAPLKVLPVSSGLPCGGSSMENSMGISKRLNFDLNHLGDDEESAGPSLHSNVWPQNVDQSASSVSSTSLRRPAVIDFDLNDNPSFTDVDGSNEIEKSCSKASNTYVGSKFDNPTITIMGSRVTVSRKDYANQMQKSFLDNEQNMDSTVAATSMLPHMFPLCYGYTGPNTGSAMSIPPSFYGSGSTPYTLGSRGNTAIGSVLSSAPSMSREGESFRQFLLQGHNQLMQVPTRNISQTSPSGRASFREFLQGHSVLMQEPMRNISQPSTSGSASFREFLLQGHSGFMQELTRNVSLPYTSGLKRKEPECGWGPHGSG